MDQTDPSFEALLQFLKQNRNFDFTGYKRAGLVRRVDRRMQSVGVESYTDYLDYLEVHQSEFTHLFNTILINVTGFFRDPAAWEYIASKTIPAILAGKAPDAPIRVWSAGCASGEEAYTIAILLAEALGEEQFRERVKIYATDLDEEALNTARQATFPRRAVAGLPPEFLEKYFEQAGNHYLFRKDLRRSVIFGRHDLLTNAPISRVDLLICRNLLMYFNVEAQARIIARFHFALNEDGFLFLGRAEMLFMHSRAFSAVDLKRRIFARTPRAGLRDRLMFMAQDDINDHSINSIDPRLRDQALDSGAVAQVVVDSRGSLILVNERARRLLGLNEWDLGRQLQEFEFSFRPADIRGLVELVRIESRATVARDIEITPAGGGESHWFDIQVVPLVDRTSGQNIGIAISYIEATQFKKLQIELQNSHQELEVAYEELQSTNEELETTNEELQSTVEELETTNEELQSTNTEMVTMNEELQSMNDEMHIVNEENRRRSQNLDQVNAFLESILTSLRSAVIVVDRDMNVQVWNAYSEELWGLNGEEVRGKHLMNLDFGFPAELLRQPIRGCINGDVTIHESTVEAVNRRGKPVTCLVRCSPLVGSSDENRGAIILFETLASERAASSVARVNGERQ